MLSPDYLAHCADDILRLYEQLDVDIINDIVRRLINTGGVMTQSAVWQAEKAQQSGMLYNDIVKRVGSKTGQTQKELKKLFEDAGTETLKYDDSIYRAAGLNPLPVMQSPGMLQTLTAGYKKCGGELRNLTLTTANTSQTAFVMACDRAYMQVSSGAFDYNTAILRAVEDVCKTGSYILYPSGHRDRIDVAIRRAVVTGTSQTCGQLQIMRMDDMGCDLVETTAHMGARPAHAMWQGRVFSRTGNGYPDFISSTGYGTGAGLMGWNCRHNFYPFFEGLSRRNYTQADLDELASRTVTYNGVQYADYEASQIQRKMEREIRDTKRTLSGIDAAGNATTDDALKIGFDDDFRRYSMTLKQQESALQDFIMQTDRAEERARVQVNGFGRGIAQKAVSSAEKQKLPNYKNAVIPDAKITGYALNKDHPTGRNKAIAFEQALGYNKDNSALLIDRVRDGLKTNPAKAREKTQYGTPFEVTMEIEGINGKRAKVKAGWLLEDGSDQPRLTSIYIARRDRK